MPENGAEEIGILLKILLGKQYTAVVLEQLLSHELLTRLGKGKTKYSVSILSPQSKIPQLQVNSKSLSDYPSNDALVSIIRQQLLQLLQQTEQDTATMAQTSANSAQSERVFTIEAESSTGRQKVFTHLFFWGFNGIYILWILYGVLQDQGLLANMLAFIPKIVSSFNLTGLIGLTAFSLLLLNPIFGMIGYTKLMLEKRNRAPKIWSFVFYGQLLLTVLAGLVFAVAQTNLNLGIVLIVSVLMLLPLQTMAITLMPRFVLKNRVTLIAALLLSTVVATVITYLAVLLSFFIPALIGAVLNWMIFDRSSLYFYDIAEVILFIIGVIVAVSAFSSPYIAGKVAVVRMIKLYRLVLQRIGKSISIMTMAGSTLGILLVVFLAAQPPKLNQLRLLDEFSKAETFAHKKQLAGTMQAIEQQIESEYLKVQNLRNSYIFTQRSGPGKLYQDTYSTPVVITRAIDDVFFILAYPFSQPASVSMDASQYDLARDRRQVFYTIFGYSPGESEALLSNAVNQRDDVSLVKRTITGETLLDSQLAEITIEEEYRNQSNREEEIVYVFTLPASAVITDLKLGANLEFQGQVAPRGAAEQVYEEQVRRQRDPALLEQVGSSQYRLRVFPIPTQETSRETGNQRVSYSYVTMLEPDGYALPIYGEEDNLETRLTDRPTPILNGESTSVTKSGHFLSPLNSTSYCNQALAPSSIESFTLSPTEVGRSGCTGTTQQLAQMPQNRRIALIVDSSARKDDQTTITSLKQFFESNAQSLNQNQIEVWQVNSLGNDHQQLTSENWRQWADELVFFGQQDPAKLFPLIPANYDLVIVVGNGSGYLNPLSQAVEAQKQPATPLYWVYLDGAPPAISQQLLQDLLRSNSGVFTSLDDVFTQYMANQAVGSSALTIGPYWTYAQSAWNLSLPSDSYTALDRQTSALSQIVTSQLIKQWLSAFDLTAAIQAPRQQPIPLPAPLDLNKEETISPLGALLDQVSLLDYLHQAATTEGIVTPYSSYIALVNAEQQARLDELSGKIDRYSTDDRAMSTVLTDVGFENSLFSSGDVMLESRSISDQAVSPGTGYAGGLGMMSFGLSSGGSANETTSATRITIVVILLTLFSTAGGGAWWWIRKRR